MTELSREKALEMARTLAHGDFDAEIPTPCHCTSCEEGADAIQAAYVQGHKDGMAQLKDFALRECVRIIESSMALLSGAEAEKEK